MKVSVSGWPGGGSSSLSVLLCKILGLKHVRGGETFRYLYKKLEFSDTGSEHLEAHNLVEPYFGPVYDMFIDHILSSKDYDNILVESDIAAFRVGIIPDLFSIFLKTDLEVRKKRMVVDNRSDDKEELENIDKNHEKTYKELHNISWFDLKEITNTHSLLLDNSELSIKDELIQIFEKMNNQEFISGEKLSELKNLAENEEEIFWGNGKAYYNQYLVENNLVLEPEEIIEIIKNKFPEKVQNFPERLRVII